MIHRFRDLTKQNQQNKTSKTKHSPIEQVEPDVPRGQTQSKEGRGCGEVGRHLPLPQDVLVQILDAQSPGCGQT